jgi:hypothetical protein
MTNFKKIQSEITSHRNNLENKKLLDIEADRRRIEKDKLILEESGVRELFEEIRDSGLVKMRFKRNNDLNVISKFSFLNWGKKKIEADYIPAKIETTNPLNNNPNVSICLLFNKNPGAVWYNGVGSNTRNVGYDFAHDYLEFSIVNSELCFTKRWEDYPNSDIIEYIPVNGSDIAELVAKEIKRIELSELSIMNKEF